MIIDESFLFRIIDNYYIAFFLSLQHTLSATMNSDEFIDPETYLVSYWLRNQGVLDEVGGVISNLKLLVQAVECLHGGNEGEKTTSLIKNLSKW